MLTADRGVSSVATTRNPCTSSNCRTAQADGDDIIDIMVGWSTPHPEMARAHARGHHGEWGCTQQKACVGAQISAHHDRVGGMPYDSRPHPRQWGTFPRGLGHYGRGLGLFSLETAVHKMSGLSARNFKFEGRGEM
jgi:N-acyl-D-amino-acid deacylase